MSGAAGEAFLERRAVWVLLCVLLLLAGFGVGRLSAPQAAAQQIVVEWAPPQLSVDCVHTIVKAIHSAAGGGGAGDPYADDILEDCAAV